MREMTEKAGITMQGNMLSKANEALIREYLEIARYETGEMAGQEEDLVIRP
jgi:hypothetical protein